VKVFQVVAARDKVAVEAKEEAAVKGEVAVRVVDRGNVDRVRVVAAAAVGLWAPAASASVHLVEPQLYIGREYPATK
jgi:hypothetical protein